MTRRPGLTMTEVLVAIFVVAIGLSGIMSMVPFGAKQMSDALVADRCTTHATAIDGLVRSYWQEKVIDDPAQNGSNEPFWIALDEPSRGVLPPPSGASLARPGPDEPSYPVFLDPMGVTGRLAADPARSWVGDGGVTNVPRRTMNSVGNNPSLALRMWSQPDGFSWDEDSRPVTNISEMREYRYNALAVLQRPTDRERNTATLKIVVFSNRRHQFFPPGSEVRFPNVAFTPTSTQITLPAASEVRKGSWIMDATVRPNSTLRHANFYRVVSAVENTPGLLDVELHTPIKRADGRNTTANGYNADVVVMPGVSAVFERPVLTGSPAP